MASAEATLQPSKLKRSTKQASCVDAPTAETPRSSIPSSLSTPLAYHTIGAVVSTNRLRSRSYTPKCKISTSNTRVVI